MYYRKLQDRKRLKKVNQDIIGWAHAGSVVENKNNGDTYFKRQWKSRGKKSHYAWIKKHARKISRVYAKRNNVYTKKSYDLWWSYL